MLLFHPELILFQIRIKIPSFTILSSNKAVLLCYKNIKAFDNISMIYFSQNINLFLEHLEIRRRLFFKSNNFHCHNFITSILLSFVDFAGVSFSNLIFNIVYIIFNSFESLLWLRGSRRDKVLH